MPAKDASLLGNIIIELGYCTEDQIRTSLATMGTQKLGEVLVYRKHLTQHQLEWALMYQSMEREEVNSTGPQIHAFIHKQRTNLVADLREVTKDMQALTAKVSAEG